MLGCYRLVLASAVALSHAGFGVYGLNPGVVAVVGFYLASGYVMTGLIRVHYGRLRDAGRFYADRALRLFPHYLVVASLTFVLHHVGRIVSSPYLSEPATWDRVLENVLVVPLNFFMFNDADRYTLIPPAWSLGAEIQFYLVVPFLLLWRLRPVAIAISAAIFLTAAFGAINSDWYGYRLLPGILFIFLIGSLLYDAHGSGNGRGGLRLTALVVALTVIVAATLHLRGALTLPYNREILLGLAVGTAAVATLGQRHRARFDDLVGNLSYGVFLNHFLVLWTVFGGTVSGPLQAFAFVATSVALSAVTYYAVERPALAWRRRLRPRPAREGMYASSPARHGANG